MRELILASASPRRKEILTQVELPFSVVVSQVEEHMPDARPLASSVLKEAGLDELYRAGAAEKQIDAVLCPPVGDGSVLQPENFQMELKGSLDVLKQCREPQVRAFVRDELGPLLENTELFKAYTGLMVGG